MTSSGTYAFNPSASDLLINAYGRIGVRRPAITTDMLIDGTMEANLLLSQWASMQPLLWKAETQTISPNPLTQGTATYSTTARTVSVLTAFIRMGTGTNQNDRVVGPLSVTDYASIPNKAMQGPPTSFWFNRQINPTITLYPTPDDGGPYTLILETVCQVQDVALTNGTTLDTPYRFFDAFTAGLAHRLARLYKPELELPRKQDAADAWQVAFGNDVEDVAIQMAPAIGRYFQ